MAVSARVARLDIVSPRKQRLALVIGLTHFCVEMCLGCSTKLKSRGS